MEDNTNSFNQSAQPATFFAFDSPKGQSSYIKVIGVGGGGGNAVNHMFREGINGVDFIVCNTDMKALNSSPVPNKISLGDLGAGNKPEKARKAALDKADDIRDAISHNTQMLFITAGMGGGTGTGHRRNRQEHRTRRRGHQEHPGCRHRHPALLLRRRQTP